MVRGCRKNLSPGYASCPYLRRESQSGARESHTKSATVVAW